MASLEYLYEECRAMGHAWRHRKKAIGVDDTSDRFPRPFGHSTGMIGKISDCASCRGIRVKWTTRSGEVINRYYMPEGYSRAGEEHKPTRREWMAHYIASEFEAFTNQERKPA